MGWTTKDFAQFFGVTEAQARQWVQGKRQPFRTKLPRFLRVFGLESELQLYDGNIAKKFSEMGLQSIGSGNADLGSLLVRLDGLAKGRMAFWNALRGAYLRHTRESEDMRWQSLDDLVDSAPPPPGLPLPSGERILDYPARHRRRLQGPAAALYRFSIAVYPAFAIGRQLGDFSIISPKQFEDFHFARMDHAKVWNRIGKLVHDHAIEFRQVIDVCPTAGPLVNVVCYLEIALAQWCRDRSTGKVYLFHLNRQWKSTLQTS